MNPKSIDKITNSKQTYMDKNNIKYMICDGINKLQYITQPILSGLYVRGDISLLYKPSISIIGPRNMSSYAPKILEHLFCELQYYDIVTVSGGAQGVDELVHTLSLTYNIPTIVVLGGGIGWYMNTGKIHFLEKIVYQGGLVVSEYDIFDSPRKYTFPQRNRIIAGLGDILFLPEAGLASGSLITVDRGIKYGKKIYAPMQDIFAETSLGSNEYITQGNITPINRFDTFLKIHFSKKSSQNPVLTVDDSDKKANIRKKRGISPSLGISGLLVEQSMLELGL